MQPHPYRVDLGLGPPPAAVIAGLQVEDRPAVLWGDWFDGGVIIARHPVRFSSGISSAAAIALLDSTPEVEVPAGWVGGGWFSLVGYDSDTSMLGWYDSVLRCAPDGRWWFETLGLPDRQAAYDAALDSWHPILQNPPEPPAWTCGAFGLPTSADQAMSDHLAGVEKTILKIGAGDLYQLNLCTRLESEFTGSPLALFAHAADLLQPARGGLIAAPDGTLASFSPELFLAVSRGPDGGSVVRTAPIKGTAPRQGEEGSASLRTSTKDIAENLMIVDLMRNDLSRVAEQGTVQVEELLGLQPHPGVWHLVSTIKANLPRGAHPATVVERCFPPGSVTGAPKSAAVRAIEELEPRARRAYTGAFGLSGPGGTEFNVVIRSYEITDEQISLGVGGGITTDSVPMLEWQECLHKASPLITAVGSQFVPGLEQPPARPTPEQLQAGIFETMLLTDGRIPWLAEHLARLDRSCQELYRCSIPDDLPAELAELCSRHRRPADQDQLHPMAVRIHARPRTASAPTFTVTTSPAGSGGSARPAVITRRRSGSWRHKWTDRTLLDRAEIEAGDATPLFVADDGTLLETTRGNVFLQRPGGDWVTPPLRDDLLPGITRRAILELAPSFGISIAIEPPARDDHYRSAFWTSSLSGCVPITAIDDHPLAPLEQAVVDLGHAAGEGV